MKKSVFISSLVVVAVVLVAAARVFFYSGGYQAPAVEKPSYDDISVPAPQSPPFAEEQKKQAGILVLDAAHDNDFAPVELNVLLSRVVSRGFAFEYLRKDNGAVGAKALEGQMERMREKLRYADALAVILPREAFQPGEVELIKEFVEKGGKLLLIGDPTRQSEINSVSARFELIFENDYLYSLKEHDGNFQNIFVTRFAQSDEITKDLAKIALYSAGSIRSPDKGIAFTDENTFSSLIVTKGKLSPLALTESSRVLALSDLTFMREPFNAAWDNNKLIANVADWLTRSQRVFVLSDFPHFLNNKVDITYSDPALIDLGIELKNFLAGKGKNPTVTTYADTLTGDTVFVGLLKDAGKVDKFLKNGKISVTVKAESEQKPPAKKDETPAPVPPGDKDTPAKATEKEANGTKIEIENIGQVFREEGATVIYLDQSNNRDVLIILSNNDKMMKDTIGILKDGKFRNWLVSGKLAIFYAPKPEAKPKTPAA
ncbi:MAG: hypothetical protein HYX79_04135 [Chloroflexi bacterium]|nr:hypothetical protein [Chloroflexota bacterium]